MSQNWQRVRMAAEYEPDVELAIEPAAERLVVAGVVVGGSYGADSADELWGLPDSYVKQFSRGLPSPRSGYDPSVDLPENLPAIDRDDRVTPATLQREVKIQIKGHGSGGRKRERRISASEEAALRALAQDVGPIEQTHLGRFVVYGLTRGESEFYHSRPGEAKAVLQQHVALVVVERRMFEIVKIEQVGKPRPNFAVYGLNDEQVRVLRVFRGSARASLVSYAHAQAGGRIRDRDRRDGSSGSTEAA